MPSVPLVAEWEIVVLSKHCQSVETVCGSSMIMLVIMIILLSCLRLKYVIGMTLVGWRHVLGNMSYAYRS